MMTLENHKSDLFYDPFVDRVDDFDRKFGKIRRKTIDSDRSSNSRSDREDDTGSRRSDEPENSDEDGV